MPEINYDNKGIDSNKVCELFLGNDPSKLEPYLFKPLASPSNEVK